MTPGGVRGADEALASHVVLAGSASSMLGRAVVQDLGACLGECTVERFPDGEIHVEVDPRAVECRHAVLVQSTSNVGSDHLLELLLMADGCRRAGAASVSAVIPYFGYARQDRRKSAGEALGVKVSAQMLATARFERVFAVDLHSVATEASLDVPLVQVSAAPLLAEALRRQGPSDAVVVAPDVGAIRLAREYSRLMAVPFAVAHKVRTSSTHVEVESVVGDVRGRRPVIVDDMIATGGTIVAAARALSSAGAAQGITVAATHAVLTPGASDRLRTSGVDALVVSDTIALAAPESWISVISVAPVLAGAIRRSAQR